MTDARSLLAALVEAVYAEGPGSLRSGDDVAWAIFLGGKGSAFAAKEYLAASADAAAGGEVRSAAQAFLDTAALESMTKAPAYIRAKRRLRAALSQTETEP